MKKPAPPRGKSQASATSAAILGRPLNKGAMTPVEANKIKPEWQGYYNCLLELRDQLLNQMSGLAKESAQEMAGYSLHMADSGTDNFDRDFALSLLSADQDSVYEIEEALKRIEKKTFGVCELTSRFPRRDWKRFRGRGSRSRRRRSWNAMARCGSGASASSARWTMSE
jgi:DnaK suppressor protein